MIGHSTILSTLSRPVMETSTEASLSRKKCTLCLEMKVDMPSQIIRGALGYRAQKDERRFVVPPACKKPL